MDYTEEKLEEFWERRLRLLVHQMGSGAFFSSDHEMLQTFCDKFSYKPIATSHRILTQLRHITSLTTQPPKKPKSPRQPVQAKLTPNILPHKLCRRLQ